MRLSATERIMRDAEHHGDGVVGAANHGDTEKASAVPFASVGFASPLMPPPLADGVDVDMDMDMEADDDGDGLDEEGETQVDAQRSAKALKQMRALEAGARDAASLSPLPLDPAPAPKRGHGIPPGRPPISTPPSPRTAEPTGIGLAGASTLTYPRALLAPALRPDPTPPDNRSQHLFSSSQLQFGSFASAPAVPGTTDPALGTPRGVGRRTGILVAVSTAAAVALIAGAWTAAQPETIPPVASAGTLTSRLAATSPKGTALVAAAPPPTVGVVVPTPPAAEVDGELFASAPAEALTAPKTEDGPPSPVGALSAPEATTAPAPVRGSAMSKRAAAAAAKKARPARKTQRMDNKRRPKVQKAAANLDGKTADLVAGRSDPDETLPPSN